eukprot:4418175-Pyramimonas_sp.AAC.2
MPSDSAGSLGNVLAFSEHSTMGGPASNSNQTISQGLGLNQSMSPFCKCLMVFQEPSERINISI